MTKLDTALSALNAGFSGTLIRPADAGYDATRQVMYGGFDQRPGLIARAQNAADVQAVVNAARLSGMELRGALGRALQCRALDHRGRAGARFREMKAIAVDAGAGPPGPRPARRRSR